MKVVIRKNVYEVPENVLDTMIDQVRTLTTEQNVLLAIKKDDYCELRRDTHNKGESLQVLMDYYLTRGWEVQTTNNEGWIKYTSLVDNKPLDGR